MLIDDAGGRSRSAAPLGPTGWDRCSPPCCIPTGTTMAGTMPFAPTRPGTRRGEQAVAHAVTGRCPTVIEFDNVSKRYPDGTVAVSGFHREITPRQVTALVGSSGCGKTTLLRMVNRMVDPSAGAVRVRGEDISRTDPVQLRRSIGYVMQSGGLLPHRSVLDNIATVPLLNGTDRKTARAGAAELLDKVGLDQGVARRYPGQLSGGQQQRVGVARALAADPDILLMDEPFGAVDPIVRRSLQDLLLQIQAELAKTVILVTHDIDEALLLGDEIIVLREGAEIARDGTPEEILSDPGSDFVADFVGVNRADRRLETRMVAGQKIVVDHRGRPVGVMD